MRLHLLPTLLACAASSLFGSVGDAVNEVTIANRTGYTIEYLFLSPADSQHWGADILDSETVFTSGTEVSFLVHYPDECNAFDLLAIDEDGDMYEIMGYEICDGTPATITIELDAILVEPYELSLSYVEFNNVSGYEMMYLFVSPGDSAMLGVDLLTSTGTLPSGESIAYYIASGDEPILFDFYAEDEDEDMYAFQFELGTEDENVSFDIELSDLIR